MKISKSEIITTAAAMIQPILLPELFVLLLVYLVFIGLWYEDL